MSRKSVFIVMLITIVAISLSGCLNFRNPVTGKIGPSWSVPLAIPLVDDTITIESILQNQSEVEQSEEGLLYYHHSVSESISIADQIDLQDTKTTVEISGLDLSVDDIEVPIESVDIGNQKTDVEIDVKADLDEAIEVGEEIRYADLEDSVELAEILIEQSIEVDFDEIDADLDISISHSETVDFNQIDMDIPSIVHNAAVDFTLVDTTIAPIIHQETIVNGAPAGITLTLPISMKEQIELPDNNDIQSITLLSGTIAVAVTGIEEGELTVSQISVDGQSIAATDGVPNAFSLADINLSDGMDIELDGEVQTAAGVADNTELRLTLSFHDVELKSFAGSITQEVQIDAGKILPVDADYLVEAITLASGALEITPDKLNLTIESLKLGVDGGALPALGVHEYNLEDIRLADNIMVIMEAVITGDGLVVGDSIEITAAFADLELKSFDGWVKQELQFAGVHILPTDADYELEKIKLERGEVILTSNIELSEIEIELGGQGLKEVTNNKFDLEDVVLYDDIPVVLAVKIPGYGIVNGEIIEVVAAFAEMKLGGFAGAVSQTLVIAGDEILPNEAGSFELTEMIIETGFLTFDPGLGAASNASYSIDWIRPKGGAAIDPVGDGEYPLANLVINQNSELEIRTTLSTVADEYLMHESVLELSGSLKEIKLAEFSGSVIHTFNTSLVDVWPTVADITLEDVVLADGRLEIAVTGIGLEVLEITIDGASLNPYQGQLNSYSLQNVALAPDYELEIRAKFYGDNLEMDKSAQIDVTLDQLAVATFSGIGSQTVEIDAQEIFSENDQDIDLQSITLDGTLAVHVVHPNDKVNLWIKGIKIDDIPVISDQSSSSLDLTGITLLSNSSMVIEVGMEASALEPGLVQVEAELSNVVIQTFTGSVTHTEKVLGSSILPTGDANFSVDYVTFTDGLIKILIDSMNTVGSVDLEIQAVKVKNQKELYFDQSTFSIAGIQLERDTELEIMVKVDAVDVSFDTLDITLDLELENIVISEFVAKVKQEIDISEMDLFVTDDYNLESLTINDGVIEMRFIEPETGLALDVTKLIVTSLELGLESDQDATPLPGDPIQLQGVVLRPDSILHIEANVTGSDIDVETTKTIRIEAELAELELGLFSGNIKQTLSATELNLDKLELDYEIPEELDGLLDSLSWIDIMLELEVDNSTGIPLNMAGLAVEFENEAGQTQMVSLPQPNEAGNYVLRPDPANPNDPIMAAIKLKPVHAEVVGDFIVGSDDKIVDGDLSQELTIRVAFTLNGSIAINIEDLDPIVSRVQTIAPSKEATDALKDYTSDLKLFVNVDNHLPVGAKLSVEFSTSDKSGDAYKVEIAEIASGIKKDGIVVEEQRSELVISVDETMREYISSGADIQASIVLLGEDQELFTMRATDYLKVQMWAEVTLKVNH